ncbi:hypothetical protein BD626DRAFT_438652 [Schizophyllum amplum]|uniref:F-box domain-containing protein n=1 Tax=Schizophyllum amplum TaxID=97359 RepID=A0A550BZX5_9AGAR|nr:hypothetical protein BD626DRAFT_438652 [Auriculariopsis ampla]
MAWISAEIERLQRLHACISVQLKINQSVASPVRRLPPELLSEVFVRLLDTAHTASNKFFLAMHTISHVCTSWRTTARNTPRLWTNISSLVLLPSSRQISYTRHVSDQAALCGTLPLHIFHMKPAIVDKTLVPFMARLRPHAAQWRTLILKGDCAALETQSALALPLLDVAHIELLGRSTRRPLSFLAGASALRSLTVIRKVMLLAPESFEVPRLSSLTCLALTGLSLMTVLSACQHCKDSLVSLHVSTLCLSQGGPTGPLTGHTNITSLRMVKLSGSAHEILGYINAPLLRDMILEEVVNVVQGDPFLSLSAFALRSSPFQRLTLRGIHAMNQPDNFLHCLERMGALRELQIADVPGTTRPRLTQEFIVRMTYADDAQCLCPGLTKLWLNFNRFRLPDQELRGALRAMVASRSASRTCASPEVQALQVFETDIDNV